MLFCQVLKLPRAVVHCRHLTNKYKVFSNVKVNNFSSEECNLEA